ncbi:hypothetical protein [Arcticibacter sp. MXS-1]|uniref:hypothetical protein n=1 Tax=Arcticibacter sp. MXS-1 TaxID=3341726 RepID=UPI0035A89F90
MPVVLIGVSGYLLLFSWMLYFGKRTNIKLLTMLLLIGIYVASTRITDYHNMTVVPKKTGQKEDSLSSYARNWILRRKAAVARLAAEGQQYPVFFVNTYGGGIRATVWTTMIVGTIDSLLKRKAIPDYLSNEFQDYIFSYSGASGGTIGAALLTAERSARLLNNSRPSLLWPGASITAVYQKDYLSADIVSLLGRDFIAGSFGLSIWDDRARLMEQDWETANPNQIPLAHSLSALWENSGYRLPLFFSNTYDIDNGYKGIAAPVKLAAADFPSVVILRSGLAPHEDIPMSTAAFVSARFPYVSPTGKLKGKHHFTDGGTYDNSGTETSLQVYQVFARELKKLAQEDTVFTHIRPQFLSLSNSVETGDSLARARNLYEPVAPLIGILAMTAGVKDRSVQQLRLVQSREGIGYFQFSPRIIKLKNNQSWPVLPLGWQISDDALLLMKLNVLDSQTGLQRILQLFPSVTRQQRPSLH